MGKILRSRLATSVRFLPLPVLLGCGFLFAAFSLGQSAGTNQSAQPSAAGLTPPSFKADFPPVVQSGSSTVAWDKGHLVGFSLGKPDTPITLYDKNGSTIFQTRLVFEGAAKTYIQDATPAKADTAVVAASALAPDGAMADLIVEVGHDGIQRAIRTSPFRILRICGTDDGAVWAYGFERNENGSDRHGHHPMLREYSFDKGQLRSDIDRATIQPAKEVPVGGTQREDLQMKCGAGKVVLINAPANELMEYDLAASLINRWPMAPLPEGFTFTGAAVTASGEVYASGLRTGSASDALTGMFHVRVNASGAAQWDKVIVVPSQHKWFRLLGSDNESLVYARGPDSPTLFWSTVAEAEVTK